MKSYIKPTVNVIELAVKESLSAAPRVSQRRTYNIRGKSENIMTNLYTATGISKIRLEPKS